MKKSLVLTPDFLESTLKPGNNEKVQLVNKLKQLATNPGHLSLRTKGFRKKEGVFESSVNMSIRMIWYYSGGDIVLTNIGRHDDLERF